MLLGFGLTFFIYTVMVYALSAMLVYFNGPFGIIDKFRGRVSGWHGTFGELFSCMFCLPTNVGMAMSLLSMFLGPELAFTPFTVMFMGHWELWPLVVPFDGLYAGGMVYLIHTVQQYIESNTPGE